MATVRRGLVDKVKRVVARASTQGAVKLVEGTAAAVRTVDKLQAKLGGARRKAAQAASNTVEVLEQVPELAKVAPLPVAKRSTARAEPNTARRTSEARSTEPRPETPRTETPRTEEPPAPRKRPAQRTAGRKTMPGVEAAAKRSKAPAKKAPQEGGFKVKRGQKHRHTGR
jgi:hypothetical protein